MYLDYDASFLKEWVDRADNSPEDQYLTKFFCYFIAFNYLYSSYAYQHERPNSERGLSYNGEIDMIKGLIFSLTKQNPHNENIMFKNYNPYDLLPENAELRRTVKSMNREDSNDEIWQRNLDREWANQLFINIYKVRCNLFHGSKSMHNMRNSSLVKESNIVLQDFLQRFLP